MLRIGFLFLCVYNVVLADIKFDNSLHSTYKATDIVKINVNNTGDMINALNMTVELCDQNTALVDVFGPKTLDIIRSDEPIFLADWKIPSEIQFQGNLSNIFQLNMTYSYKHEGKLVTKKDSHEITIFNITAVSDEKVTKVISPDVALTEEEPISTNSTDVAPAKKEPISTNSTDVAPAKKESVTTNSPVVKESAKSDPQVESPNKEESTETYSRTRDALEPETRDQNPDAEILGQDYGATWAYKVVKALLMNQLI
ncbi:hypothetical protein K7432_012471 [Basidiobolus ranarum]|uniref:Uncharacterized protein n=1 Tax=Basidiobolus ranarum TaxID=34480 RepID=A0ABR2WKX6_9FUNG